jgi:hypothetical protein
MKKRSNSVLIPCNYIFMSYGSWIFRKQILLYQFLIVNGIYICKLKNYCKWRNEGQFQKLIFYMMIRSWYLKKNSNAMKLLLLFRCSICLSDIPCDNTFIWLLADTSLFCKSPTWKKKGYVNKCWYICFR